MRILTLALLLSLSACATTEYVEITPQCSPPSAPALPSIDRGSLWDALGDAEYRRLEAYILGLWAHSDEQGALLDVLCAD